jgi:hypothetical protein
MNFVYKRLLLINNVFLLNIRRILTGEVYHKVSRLVKVFCGGNPCFSQGYIVGIGFITDIFATRFQRRNRAGAAAHEGVQDHIAGEGIELDQAEGELDWERAPGGQLYGRILG